MSWKDFSRTLPWVATVQTFNNDWTVYACLQQACKQFDFVIVVDDGSTDNTFVEIDRFIRREKPKNLKLFDLSSFDPAPDQAFPKREGMVPTKKTQSKSKFKSFDLAKKIFPNGIWVSIESDTILADNARLRMQQRIENWQDPYLDCEFYNLVMTIDPWHVRSVSLSEKEYIKPHGIKHRREYDHPGDWCLASSWLGGKLTIGPDPQFPYGPCFHPWTQKNQLSKKGQDDSPPFGFHFLSYRNDEKDVSYEDRRFLSIENLKDKEVDWSLLQRLRFPVLSKLTKEGKRLILSCDL
jgi:hypothetical protein